jgi:hypothetical protein
MSGNYRKSDTGLYLYFISYIEMVIKDKKTYSFKYYSLDKRSIENIKNKIKQLLDYYKQYPINVEFIEKEDGLVISIDYIKI